MEGAVEVVGEVKKRVGAVVLAAGASSRMGRMKALLEYGGETFVDRQVRAYAGLCEPVVVVVSADGAAELVAGMKETERVVFVLNPRVEGGMISSLRCGLRALGGVEGALYAPVDGPGVKRETVAKLVAEWCGGVARARGGGHPVVVGREVMGELMSAGEGVTAREVLARHEAQLVDVEDEMLRVDVDTPDEYRALVEERKTK